MRHDLDMNVYRVAYDEAFSELREILREFEQLRVRKDRIEKVVKALQPEIGSQRQVTVTNHRPRTRHRAHTAVLTHSTFV